MAESLTCEPLRVARIWHRTTAEGPGLRTAIWVQGCSVQCPGCINQHLWTKRGGNLIETEALADEVAEAGVEGVTLLGGEPFDQADACASLAERLHSREIGVIVFTGFTYETLAKGSEPGWIRLLEATDLLVDGPFDRANPETNRAWVGSSNQRFIHLSDRYQALQPEAHRNRLELRITPSGEVDVCGFVTTKDLARLRSELDLAVEIHP